MFKAVPVHHIPVRTYHIYVGMHHCQWRHHAAVPYTCAIDTLKREHNVKRTAVAMVVPAPNQTFRESAHGGKTTTLVLE